MSLKAPFYLIRTLTLATVIFAHASSFAADLSWDSNGGSSGQTDGSGAWLGADQWWNGSGNVSWTSGAAASFGHGGSGNAVTLASPATAESLTFNGFSGTYTLGTAGQSLTINSGVELTAAAGNVTFAGPITLGGDQTWLNNSAGTLLTGKGANLIDNGGYQLIIDGTGASTLGVINNSEASLTGAGALIKNGSGRLSVGGVNSGFTGTVTINGGQLIGHNNAGVLGNGNVTLNGGVLSFYWGVNYTRVLGAGNNQLQIIGGESGFGGAGTSAPGINLGSTVVWGAAGEGAASGYFNPAQLVLGDPATSNAGSTNFSSGIDLNGASRTISVPRGSSATGNLATLSGVISNSTGTAGLVKAGGGTLILSKANSYNGGTTLEAGTLQLGHVNSLGPDDATLTLNGGLLNINDRAGFTVGNLTGTGGTIANNGNAALTFTIGTGDATGGDFQGVIADNTNGGSGSLGLAKVGTGTVILSGDNTYSGPTTISAGTLQIGSGGSSGSLATSLVVNAGTLVYDRSDEFSIGYSITGIGKLVKQGAGTLIVPAPSIYSGQIRLESGVLQLDQPNTANDALILSIAGTGAAIDLNFTGPQTLGDLFIGETRMPDGVYKAIGSPADGTELAQITGTGTLSVTGDIYPPSLVSISSAIDTYAAPAGIAIVYTITFSEDIDSSTVSADDFANAGTAPISIGAITGISSGVFTVEVTPNGGGTLQLSIPAGATIHDASGNAMDSSSALLEATLTRTYLPDAGAVQFIGASPVATNIGSTITLQMPEGAQPGDLLVANIVNYASGQYGAVFNSGTGWSSLKTSRMYPQENTRLGVYYREVQEGDPDRFELQLGYDAPYAAAGVMMAFSNVDLVSGPTDGSGASSIRYGSAPRTTVDSPHVYSSTPYALFLFLGMAIADNSVSFSNWSNPDLGILEEIYDGASEPGIKTISLSAAMGTKEATGLNNGGTADLSALAYTAAIQIPLKPTGNSALVSALVELKAHVTGESPLSGSQIAAHKATIVDNRLGFRSSANSIAAAMDLVHTYDEELGPLWVARSLPNRAQLTDDIHYTVFKVMQYLMDYGYSTTNLTNHYELFNGFAFGSSANFPGPCPPPEDPEAIHTVLIDADYPNTWGREVFGQSDPSPKPTGTYLAPGSIATVTVPAALVGRGYYVRVGAHAWDFEEKTAVKRLDRCAKRYSIDSTTIKVANPLGGGIYIEVPQYIEDIGVVSVQIQNAVRSPYFSAKSFHQTTLSEWQNIERHHPAPWADFQSEKVMMQVPTSWIYAMDDPATLMADWDKAADILNDFMGFPRDRGRETIYNQVDLLLRAVAYTPGYPAVNNTYNPNQDYGGYANNYLVRGPQYATDFEFHELGHAYRFDKFPGETESDVNLLHVPVFHGFGYTLDEAFRASRGAPEYATLETTAIAWMMCDNFLNGNIMEQAEKQYALKGHAKFVEIARLFGWERLSNYFKSFNEDYENGVSVVDEVDSLLLRLSTRVGIDLRPLFHFWGVPPVNAPALESSIAAANLPDSGMIYDTLVRYKSLIPADNSEFRTFALGWWERQPLDSGFSEERNHASRWADYDPAMATATADRAQEIIDLYFPNGRPADYGDWRSQWPEADLLDPRLDLDGDGMNNKNERIWGLDPTSAWSRNPIISGSDFSSGRLTYTRRSPALSGLNYSVWTSTDLSNWDEDTGAQQIPAAADANGVESVEIILSPQLLEHPSLFIQLRTSD